MDINYLKIQKIKAFDSTSNSEEGEKKKKNGIATDLLYHKRLGEPLPRVFPDPYSIECPCC